MKVIELVQNRPAGITVLERLAAFVAVREDECSEADFAVWANEIGKAEDLAFMVPDGDSVAIQFASKEAVERTRNTLSTMAKAMGCIEFSEIVMLDEEQIKERTDLKDRVPTNKETVLGTVMGFEMSGLPKSDQLAMLRDGRVLDMLQLISPENKITQNELSEFATELEAYYGQQKG